MKQWLTTSARAQAEAIRRGELSSERLVETHLEQVARVNRDQRVGRERC